MSELISVTLPELLEYRSLHNKSIYMRDCAINRRCVNLLVQAEYSIILTTTESKMSPALKVIAPYCNKAIQFYDKRIVTHDYTDNSEWPAEDNSLYTIEPTAGMKYMVSFIIVRFPKNIKIKEENALHFQVNLWSTATESLQPVIDIAYTNLRELVRKSNCPLSIPPDLISEVSGEKMNEIIFKYADENTMKGSPLVLHSSLGENIKIWLSGHTPLKTTAEESTTDGTWAVVNGKQTLEF